MRVPRLGGTGQVGPLTARPRGPEETTRDGARSRRPLFWAPSTRTPPTTPPGGRPGSPAPSSRTHTRARLVNPGRARQRHAPPTSCPGYPASPQRVGQSGAAARRGRGPCEHKRPETHTVSGAVTMTTGALAPPRTQPGTRPRAGGGGQWGVSPAVRSASRPRPLRNRVTFCPGLNSLLNSTFTESLLCPEARDPPPNRSDSKQNPALGWLIPGGRVRKGRNQRA